MATLAKLYRQAKEAGFKSSDIRGKSAEEIQELLANGGGKKSPAKKKAVVKKAVAAKKKGTGKRGRPKGSKNKPKAEAPKKRGRPKGSGKKSTSKASGNGEGRHLLSKIDYNKTEGWNPREGSPPDRIVKALKKFKGDREKVFDFLKSDLWDFMGKVKRDGTKRTKAEAEDMLRYRIARTDWQFAIMTGQHEKASNRAEYGSGGGAPKKKAGKKVTEKKATKKATKKAAPAEDANVKEMSDTKLRKIVKAVEGKRGRPSKLVLAARAELAKREKKGK